jgi:elongation factor P--(R)-beta-lysine ligase
MLAESKIAKLKDRALFLQKARSFFIERGLLEVDTPILSKTAPIDEHIEIMTVSLGEDQTGYLHSSPEYAMKRLLSMGSGDIFQISHVFRQGEVGPLHNPEFTMAEWYRMNISFSSFIDETVEFIQLFLGPLPVKQLSYKDAFLLFTNIDPSSASALDLLNCATAHGLDLSSEADKDTLLHLLMGFVIEPNLGQGVITILTDYPASQAALAQIEEKNGEKVAKRFEAYYQGIELANGYLELTDAKKQNHRLLEANQKRIQGGKASLPLDTHFLKALEKGIPPCCGVAVGFDRLLLLKNKSSSLEEILPFSWTEV